MYRVAFRLFFDWQHLYSISTTFVLTKEWRFVPLKTYYRISASFSGNKWTDIVLFFHGDGFSILGDPKFSSPPRIAQSAYTSFLTKDFQTAHWRSVIIGRNEKGSFCSKPRKRSRCLSPNMEKIFCGSAGWMPGVQSVETNCIRTPW